MIVLRWMLITLTMCSRLVIPPLKLTLLHKKINTFFLARSATLRRWVTVAITNFLCGSGCQVSTKRGGTVRSAAVTKSECRLDSFHSLQASDIDTKSTPNADSMDDTYETVGQHTQTTSCRCDKLSSKQLDTTIMILIRFLIIMKTCMQSISFRHVESEDYP